MEVKKYLIVSLFLLLGSLFINAGQVVVKDGELNVTEDFFGGNVLYVNSSSGNVGIGVANPLVILQAGSATNRIGAEPRTDGMDIGGISASNAVRLGGFYNNNPIPGAAIHFGAQGGAGQRGAIAFLTKSTDDDSTQPSAKMVVTQTGNVGIGTTNPGYKFHVEGTVALAGLTQGSGNAICYNPATGEIYANGGATTCAASSLRYKHDIKPYDKSGLDVVNQLKPVSFVDNAYNQAHIGLIAEDVYPIEPRLVFLEQDGSDRPKGIKYEELTAVLVKAVQEQQTKIKLLESELCKKDSTYTWCAA